MDSVLVAQLLLQLETLALAKARAFQLVNKERSVYGSVCYPFDHWRAPILLSVNNTHLKVYYLCFMYPIFKRDELLSTADGNELKRYEQGYAFIILFST